MTKKMFWKSISILLLAVYLTACSLPGSSGNLPAATSQVVELSTSTSTPTVRQTLVAEPTTTQGNTDTFTLTSPEVTEGGELPVEYTCDGASATLPLAWSSAPVGTVSYALIMHHIASPTDIHWYWVLYDIPTSVTSLPKNVTGIGVLGTNINNDQLAYSPPCSKGPGPKTYTYTVYALSAQPVFSVPASQVDRAALLEAMKDITLASAELNVTYSRQTSGLETPEPAGAAVAPPQGQGQPAGGGTPPAEAVAACTGKTEQDACEFTSQKGTETGVCETVQSQLACSPKHGPNDNGQANGNDGQQNNNQTTASNPAYNIEQAISDKAQGMTISFDALAFLTGDLGSDSFFPPGKVADFWGFQYLRDNDTSEMGHAGDFLTSAAMNTLNNLTADQRAELVALAKSQVSQINEYGYKRFVLMEAFRRLMDGDLPTGTTGLNEGAVEAYSAELYRLDGAISYARAQLMGKIITGLSAEQKAYFDNMKGKGMLEWPSVEEPPDIQGLDRDVKVAVMTYAADLYSWYVGSVDADIYFCPERHGTYFGSFYLKDAPAMLDSTYAIPTNLTGDMGEKMLAILTPDQAQLITDLVDIQKPYLTGIVDTRQEISVELRKFKEGNAADSATVQSLLAQYGQLDGEIIYNLAVHFTQVSQSLTSDQKTQLLALRKEMLGDLIYPSGAYLYSQAIPMPDIPNTDFLFK